MYGDKPTLSGAGLWLPRGYPGLSRIRKRLQVSIYDMGNDEPKKVEAYRQMEGGLMVPRQFGLSLLKSFQGVDRDLPSYPEIADFVLPDLWDYQKPWVSQLVEAAEVYGDVVAMAATGKGKTVMSLYAACQLGGTTLIIVDQEFLRDQWISALTELYRVPREDIGLIQGKVCDVEGKSFVVGMVQTLYRRPDDAFLRDYFATVILDECHTVGAPQYSKVLFMFNPAHRIAVSATPKRGDSLDRILQWHLGPVRVELKDKHDKSSVRFIDNHGVYSWYANISPKTGRFVNELAEDGARNDLLGQAIVWLYETGRDVLVLSDRIYHVQSLMSYCRFLRIPEEEMGLVCGYRMVWKYDKDPAPKRRPPGYARGTEYTPVKLQLVKKRIPKKELDEIKKTKSIIFATYGMFSKGVDVPRLSGGIDCTPRSKAEQIHGRILRRSQGKKTPIWVTVRDLNSFRSLHMLSKRVAEYSKSNAEIFEWKPNKGVKQHDPKRLAAALRERVERLKRYRIEAGRDGNNIIQTQSTGNGSRSTPVARTGRKTRKRPL